VSGQRPWPLAAWFRASRRVLAAELAHGGWLNFGRFRWPDVNVTGGLRAGAGMVTPLAVGLITGHLGRRVRPAEDRPAVRGPGTVRRTPAARLRPARPHRPRDHAVG
jgi:hypothetical protein